MLIVSCDQLDENIHFCPTKVISLENTLGKSTDILRCSSWRANTCLSHRRVRLPTRGDRQDFKRGPQTRYHYALGVSFALLCELPYAHAYLLLRSGARIWEAAAATGLSIEELCRPFDTISLCMSKGIGAPIGS